MLPPIPNIVIMFNIVLSLIDTPPINKISFFKNIIRETQFLISLTDTILKHEGRLI